MKLSLIYKAIGVSFFITCVCLLIYAGVQQELRLSANDPQIQMAEDVAAKLSMGDIPDRMVPSTLINIAESLSPFIIIFDNSGQPLVSEAILDGKIPHLPQGVFTAVKNSGEDRITWQPRVGVRVAAVVVHTTGSNPGFVLAGRSLREVEAREDSIFRIMIVGWFLMECGIFVFLFAPLVIVHPKRHHAS